MKFIILITLVCSSSIASAKIYQQKEVPAGLAQYEILGESDLKSLTSKNYNYDDIYYICNLK